MLNPVNENKKLKKTIHNIRQKAKQQGYTPQDVRIQITEEEAPRLTSKRRLLAAVLLDVRFAPLSDRARAHLAGVDTRTLRSALADREFQAFVCEIGQAAQQFQAWWLSHVDYFYAINGSGKHSELFRRHNPGLYDPGRHTGHATVGGDDVTAEMTEIEEIETRLAEMTARYERLRSSAAQIVADPEAGDDSDDSDDEDGTP